MWKLLGTLSGAALVGLWWLLVLEHPVLQQQAAAADRMTLFEVTAGSQPAGRGLEGPKLPTAAASRPPAEPEPQPPAPAEAVDEPLPPEPAAQAEPGRLQDEREPGSPPAATELESEPPRVAIIPTDAAPEPLWHPLWTPFRSQASAQGFAKHLSRLSGRDLEVEHQGPARYQVQLAYRDAADLQLGLARIAEVSGLLPEAPP